MEITLYTETSYFWEDFLERVTLKLVISYLDVAQSANNMLPTKGVGTEIEELV